MSDNSEEPNKIIRDLQNDFWTVCILLFAIFAIGSAVKILLPTMTDNVELIEKWVMITILLLCSLGLILKVSIHVFFDVVKTASDHRENLRFSDSDRSQDRGITTVHAESKGEKKEV